MSLVKSIDTLKKNRKITKGVRVKKKLNIKTDKLFTIITPQVDKLVKEWGKSGIVQTMTAAAAKPQLPSRSVRIKVPTPKVDTSFKIDLSDFQKQYPPGTSWADMCDTDEED